MRSTTRLRARSALISALIVGLAAPATAFALRIAGDRPTGGTPGTQLIGNIAHVANLAYTGGSDVEFASREVVKLSEGATGDPVCAKDESGACLVDGAGNIVYETEVRDFAIAGRTNNNAWIIDITDPATPVKIGEVPCRANQNDIQIRGDILLVAQDSGTGSCVKPIGPNQSFTGSAVLDFSNPRAPVYLSRLQEGRGAHNHTLHPTQPLVYISNSDQTGDGRVHIWDISDPAAPVKVQDWVYLPAESPHDITFNADGTRAYLAARTFTHIVNTEDPRNPLLVSSLPHHGYLSHQSDPTPDGKYLLVSEELLGGGSTTASPGGPMYIWDIRDETHPVEIGAFGNDELGVNGVSTSHVFRINPDGFTMAVAWYNDGVGVVDYSSMRGANAAGAGAQTGAGPRVLAWAKMPSADAWSAKMWQERHPGYVFVNDLARGFDVFYASDLGPGFVAQGTLHLGWRANYSLDTGITRQEWEADCDLTPRTQGVDGWVLRLPDGLDDGTHTMTAARQAAAGGALVDLDLYFYDEDCTLIGADEDAGFDETGEIPAGTEYVMVACYTEGGLVRVRVTAS